MSLSEARGRDLDQDAAPVSPTVTPVAKTTPDPATDVGLDVSRLEACLGSLADSLRHAHESATHCRQGGTRLAELVSRLADVVDTATRDAAATSTSLESVEEELGTTAAVIGEAMEHISEVAQQIEQTDGVLQQLKSESKTIAPVLETIHGITIQSHMLGLNATIEAARAGEYGRGFAVVASAVRDLSRLTKESTVEISASIERLQEGIDAALTMMEKACNGGEACVAQAMMATETLETVSDSIKSIREASQEVGDPFAECRGAASAATDSCHRVAAESDATDALISRAYTLCEELGGIVRELRERGST